MDLLSRSARFKEHENGGESAESIVGVRQDEPQQFVRDTRKFHLYGGPRS